MMKSILLIGLSAVFLAAVRAEEAAPATSDEIDVYTQKTIATLELVKTVLKSLEPIKLSDIIMPNIPGLMTKLSANFTDVTITGLSDFVVSAGDQSTEQQTVSLNVTFPMLVLKGNYHVNGTSEGLDVEAKDTFELILSNTVSIANIVYESGKIGTIGLTYTIGDLLYHADGDNIEGLTTEQIENLFSYVFMMKARVHGKFIANTVAEGVKAVANAYITGQGLTDAVQWARHFAKTEIFG